MSGKTFRGGVHPAEKKELSQDKAFVPYLPIGDLVFPVSQHIGKPAIPVVAVGDRVLAGQLLAEHNGYVSANVICSVSGRVKAIEPRATASGAMVQSIVVENDGQYEALEGVGTETAYYTLSNYDIIKKIQAAGIVGMGGAGFPTNVKMNMKDPGRVRYVIANGAECEPYITCDDQLMRTYPDEIVKGMEVILRLFPHAIGIIAVEENKPEAIRCMQEACGGSKRISVLPLQTKYPQGGERSLISVISGKHLKLGMLPADAGCVVDNVATVRAVYRAVCLNEPLMERGVTVSGNGVENPGNFLVKIGTNTAELIAACGGFRNGAAPKKILSGGPMMGIAMATADVPVCKNHNAVTVLAQDETEQADAQMTACLRCGRCNRACPLGLSPQLMQVAAQRKDYDRYEHKLYGLECIACGCCTYNCPAKRPLMQLFKLTKAEIMAAKRR